MPKRPFPKDEIPKSTRERTWWRGGVGTVRQCFDCAGVKPLTKEFWPYKQNQYQGICKDCTNAKRRAHRAELKALGLVDVEAERRKKTEFSRKWREKNREKARALQRAYKARVRADPERHARFRETERIAYRLRLERRGKTLEQVRGVKSIMAPEPRLQVLPSKPIVDLIERRAKMTDLDVGQYCETRLGFEARSLYRWRKEGLPISFNMADGILQALDLRWEDVWPRDEWPEAYENPLLAAA